MTTEARIVIVGAGPTGLGAAHRLRELGYDDYVVLEASEAVGGLARSCTDSAGFTYDIGGHVLFSHYDYYQAVVDKVLGDAYTEIEREAWVWMEERFVPYPFQNNFTGLEAATVHQCVGGLIAARRGTDSPGNFEQWVYSVFGAGIAEHFMLPYNWKVWATPPELMSYEWIAERVSPVDLDAVLRNGGLGEKRVKWGPNATFRYPLRGGTGFLWDQIAASMDDHLERCCRVSAVDPARKAVVADDGRRFRYDRLLSTVALDDLVGMIDSSPPSFGRAAAHLMFSGTHVVGVGLDRPCDTTKNWIYFPEPNAPFYRVTYLSNYSPHMTAQPDQTLLLAETSTSSYKREDPATIVDRVIDGLVATRLMDEADREAIVTTWLTSPRKTYPVPTLDRNAALATIEPWLEALGISSRGRFGTWRYEIGNMDHSFMQGVEWVDRALLGEPETVWTPIRE